MNKVLIVLFAFLTLSVLSGCVAFTVVQIPRTTENLQAIRDCQRTFAVATGYSQYSFQDLKQQCYQTLEGTSSQVVQEWPHPPAGCQQIDEANSTYYYVCPPQNRKEP